VYQWRVIALSAFAVLLLLAGFLALTLPDSYEGRVLYVVDEQHAICALDGLGGLLLILGCLLAWGAGVIWQRRMYAT
jgi:hypothetical protein